MDIYAILDYEELHAVSLHETALIRRIRKRLVEEKDDGM